MATVTAAIPNPNGSGGFHVSNTVARNESLDQAELVVEMDKYNVEEGKIQSSVSWIVSAVFGRDIPPEYVNIFYRNDQGDLHVKPAILYNLCNGEFYCATAATIFQDPGYINQNHGLILQTLSRHGIHVKDQDNKVVTETLLTHSAPVRMSAHLALIDGLMSAAFRQALSVERIVGCVKRYTPVGPHEVPVDLEDALLFWINKIAACVRDRLDETSGNPGEFPLIPEMEDLYEDLYDCCCLCTVVSHYCPQKLKLDDVCFNDPMSIGDSLHNIRLIEHFCKTYLPVNIFHFQYEDVLYMPEALKPNILIFLAELFQYLETPNHRSEPAASMTKRVVPRATAAIIPDLRGGDSSKGSTPLSTKQSVANSQRHTNAAPAPGSLSGATSLMNSADSLATMRSVDSLKYPAMQKSSNVNGQSRFAGHSASSDSESLRKSPTTNFASLPTGTSPLNVSTDNPPWSNGPVSPKTMQTQNGRPPLSSIQMQLQEKRRLYETKKQQLDAELTKQRELVGKEVFFQAMGKPAPTRNGSQSMYSSGTSRDQNGGQMDELNKTVKALQGEIQRLSVEQNKLSQRIVAEGSQQPMFAVYPQGPSVLAGATQLPTVFYSHGPPQTLPAMQFTPQTQHQHIATSPTGGFRLFDATGGQPGDDPALELSKTMSTYGMTYQPSSEQSAPAASSKEHLISRPQSQTFARRQTSVPPELVPHIDDYEQRATWADYQQRSPVISEAQQGNSRTQKPESPGQMPQSLNGFSVQSGRTNEVMNAAPGISDMSVQNNAQSSQGLAMEITFDENGARPKMGTFPRDRPPIKRDPNTRHPANEGVAPHAMTKSAVSGVMTASDDSHEMSPGVGFVVSVPDMDKQDAELERRREQILANAMRRREQHEARRMRVEQEQSKRQQDDSRKQEEQEKRRIEQEMRRKKAWEQYQQRKAEQDSLDNPLPPSARPIPSTLRPKQSQARGHSQPPRPKSQVVPGAHVATAESAMSASTVGVPSSTSVDRLDQVDSYSQGSSEHQSQVAEPTVKLFVKPTQKSNRSIIYNALQYSCLAGEVNAETKRKVLDELAKSDSKHFLVLFRDHQCQFRGLYCWDQVSDTAHKLYGTGPRSVGEAMINLMYKYDSGAKQFSGIPAKHLSATIDGFTIMDHFWQKKKPMFAKS